MNLELALKSGLTTVPRVLDLLKEIRPSVDSYIIYSIVCRYTKSINKASDMNIETKIVYKDHICSDGKPFLNNASEEYKYIYKFYNPESDIKPKVSKCSVIDIDYICGSFNAQYLSMSRLSFYLRAGFNCPAAYYETIIETDGIIENLFCHDQVDILSEFFEYQPTHSNVLNWYRKIAMRIGFIKSGMLSSSFGYDITQTLNENSTDAYFMEIIKYYNILINKMLDYRLPNQAEMKELNKYFPKIFKYVPDTDYSKVLLKLDNLELQAYILGIPIHQSDYKPVIVLEHLHKLEEMGLEKYIDDIAQKNEEYFRACFPTSATIEAIDPISGENMWAFNRFDILPYDYQNGRIVLFLREEAKNMISKRRDRYNSPISKIFCDEIADRQSIALNYELCLATDLYYIWDSLLNNRQLDKPVSLDNENTNVENNNMTNNGRFNAYHHSELNTLFTAILNAASIGL